MLFHSQIFILGFLPVCLSGFFLAGRLAGRTAALGWLIAASLFFYGWWNPAFTLLLVGSIGGNFALGCLIRRLAEAPGPSRDKGGRHPVDGGHPAGRDRASRGAQSAPANPTQPDPRQLRMTRLHLGHTHLARICLGGAIAANLAFLAQGSGEEFCEYSTSRSPLRWDLTEESFEIGDDGRIAVPDRPGLGVTLNMETVGKFALS